MRVVCLLLMGITYASSLTAASTKDGTAGVRRYAIIIANNRSLDEGVEPLRYADDDGVRYYELFNAAGAETKLLAVLDSDAQQLYPAAAAVSIPPSKNVLQKTLRDMFAAIRSENNDGLTTHFYFIYAGHGNVGPNQEGYLNLLDERFGRSQLYAEVIQKSPATFNHIILDACQAWFMVHKRGGEPDKTGDYRDVMRGFLNKETLARYPNTGVILAASNESETHEWQQFESGIFSYEIRSALSGAADVNNDNAVTYAEAAAFVEAANAGIEIPKARLNVFYHAPPQRLNEPLITTDAFDGVPTLSMPVEMSGKYCVEDARGVRLLDLNYSSEQPVSIALIGTAPFYVRRADEKALIETGQSVLDLSKLQFAPFAESSRGPIDESFRKYLFTVPFGMGFFRGTLINNDRKEYLSGANRSNVDVYSSNSIANANQPLQFDTGKRENSGSLTRKVGLVTLVTGVSTGTAAAVLYASALLKYKDYKAADTRDDALELRDSCDNLMRNSRILAVVSAGLTLAGGSLLLARFAKRRKAGKLARLQIPLPYASVEIRSTVFGIAAAF